MLAQGKITGETEMGRKALAFVDNSTALVGLLVFGFPVTAAALKSTVVSWVLIAIGTKQFIVSYFRPRMWLGPRGDSLRTNQLILNAVRLERGVHPRRAVR